MAGRAGAAAPRRWPGIVATALIIVGAGAIGAAIVNNRNSKTQPSAVASTAPVVKPAPVVSTSIGQCVERVRAPFRIVKNASRYVGKDAVVNGVGSREGTVHATVQADGRFTAQFTQTLQRTSPTKCTGKLTFTVVSVGGVIPTVTS